MGADKNGFGPGLPYFLDCTDKLPAATKWALIPCPTCGHLELMEIVRSETGEITGFRFHQQPVETLLPEAKADLSRQRQDLKLAFDGEFPKQPG